MKSDFVCTRCGKKYERDSNINPSNVTIWMLSGSTDVANESEYTYLVNEKVFRAVCLCPECEKEFVNWLSLAYNGKELLKLKIED